MPARRPYDEPEHRVMVKRLKAGFYLCVHCAREGRRSRATVPDHQPAVSLHEHRSVRSGCCRLVPSCKACSARQGKELQGAATLRRSAAVTAGVDVFEPAGFAADDAVWDVAPWLAELRDVPDDAIWPRLMSLPSVGAVGTFGGDFERWAADVYGMTPYWWQRLVAYRLLEHDAGGQLVWQTLILTLSRQLGKSTLLSMVLLWRMVHGRSMFGEPQLVIHTARDLAVCREVQLAARSWAKARHEFKVIEANGKEMIEHLPTGSRWLVRAEQSVYGFSATTVLADEVWDFDKATIDSAIVPSMVAHEQSQLLMTSTANVSASEVLPRRRAGALENLVAPDGDLLIEWSAPRGADVTDRGSWRLASPRWTPLREREIARAVAEAQAVESDVGDDPFEHVRTEWLNIWPVRSQRGPGEPLFAPGEWAKARGDVDAVGGLVLAVDEWMGTGAAAAAAGMTDDGRVTVGGWLFPDRVAAYEWAAGLAEQYPGSQLLVGVLLRADREAAEFPGPVESRGPTDLRSALSMLRELVGAGLLVHDGNPGGPPDLEVQMGSARVRRAPSGGLVLLDAGRLDLVRCVAWAAVHCYRTAGMVPAVHGVGGG